MATNKNNNIKAWLQSLQMDEMPEPPIPPVPPVPPVPRVPPLLRPFPPFKPDADDRDVLPLLSPPLPDNKAPRQKTFQLPTSQDGASSPPSFPISVPSTPPAAPPQPRSPQPKKSPPKGPLRSVLKKTKKPSVDATGAQRESDAPLQQFACREDTVVRFLLLKAHDLDPIDDRDTCYPYVIFKLGKEKYTSKVIEDTNDPVWNESFDIFVPAGKSLFLQIMIMDKHPLATSDFIGRFNMNLADYQYHATYEVQQDLDDNAGRVQFRMVLERVGGEEYAEVSELPTRQTLAILRKRIAAIYGRWSLKGALPDVGEVLVIAHGASTIAPPYSEDKLNAICVVELAPKMLWNRGDPKTVNPTWNTMYRMKVTDIHAVLQVTVLTDIKRQEFLGTVAFPLISAEIQKKQWFALKDQSLEKPTGGFILLEIDLIYNPLKAMVQCFKDKGPGPPAMNDTELTRSALARNMSRIKAVYQRFKRLKRFLLGCFYWDSVVRSVVSLVLFVWLTLKGEAYMVPLICAVMFFVEFIAACCCPDDEEEEELQMDGQQDNDDASKQTLKEKLVRLQEIAAMMQNTMGTVASYGERLHNTMVFADPFVSKMFLAILLGAGFLAYIVPARYWILMLGLRKYVRGFMRKYGGAKDSGYDLLHLFNRTPDNFEKSRYSEPLPDTDTVPRGTFAAKRTFSLNSLRRLFS